MQTVLILGGVFVLCFAVLAITGGGHTGRRSSGGFDFDFDFDFIDDDD